MKEKNKNFKRLVIFAIAIALTVPSLTALAGINIEKISNDNIDNLSLKTPQIMDNPGDINEAPDRGCTKLYYGEYPSAYYYWTIPDAYGDDYFNERFTMPFDGDLTTAYINMYLTGSVDITGEGIDVIVWDDDGFGYPNSQLGSVNIPTSSMVWYPTEMAVDLTSLGLSFSAGEDFHIGYTTVNQGAGNIMAVLSDDGATNDPPYELRSSEYYYGSWGLMYDDWGLDADFLIAAEVCEEVVWPDCKMHFPQLPDPNGWDVFAYYPEYILADDFLCMESGPITDLHFWGSWFFDEVPVEPAVGAPFGFHISFHADIPDPDGPGPLYSMPGALLWERDIFYPDFSVEEMPPSPQGWFEPPSFFIMPNHERYFRYDIDFVGPFFEQTEGTIYWVDIAPIHDPGFFWGWKTSLDHWNDDAVYTEPGGGGGSLLTEDFEGYDPGIAGGIPPDWTVITADTYTYGNWAEGSSTYARTGDYCAKGDPGSPTSGTNALMATKQLSLSSSPGDLSFWYRAESSSHFVDFDVLVTTDSDPNTATWTTLGSLTAVSTAYTEQTYGMSAYASQDVYVAWQMTDADVSYYYMFIDDISLDGWSEGFEGTPPSGFPPAGWTHEVVSGTDTDNYWKINDTTTYPSGVIPTSGTYMAEYDVMIISSGNSARLYTPELSFSGTNHELKFEMYHDDDYDTKDDKVTIQVSTDESSWTDITEFLTYAPTEGWETHTVDLSAYDGESSVWVGFLGVSDYGYNNVYIDDVEVTSTGGAGGWAELIDPITFESLDMAFVITGEGGPTNTPPVAVCDSAITLADTAVVIDILANDYDPDSPSNDIDPTTVVIVTDVTHGGTSIDPVTGDVTYTPDAGYSGSDSFTYTVDDTFSPPATSNVATVDITIVGTCHDDIWVDDDAAPGWYNWTHVLTIQTGVDRVADSGTVHVYDGTYAEDVVVGDSPYCPGRENIIIHGEGLPTSNNTRTRIDGTITVNTDSTTIEFLFFEGTSDGAVTVNNDDCVIHSCMFDIGCTANSVGVIGNVPADATFNWWGAPDGPDGGKMIDSSVANGYGAKVQGDVLVEPWVGVHAGATASTTSILTGTPITFDAYDSFAYKFDGTPGNIGYLWNFDDGLYSIEEQTGHVYDTAGTYHAYLMVTGCDASVWGNIMYDWSYITITVSNPGSPLTANANTNNLGGYEVVKYDTLQLSGSATGGTPPYTYEWDFGDGTTGTEQNPVHVYDNEGTYTMTLTVSDGTDTATDTAQVTVYGLDELVANAGGPYTSMFGDVIFFYGSATGGLEPYTYEWDFGDGTPKMSGHNTVHVYENAGTYTATVTVTDDEGTVDTHSTQVTIEEESGDAEIKSVTGGFGRISAAISAGIVPVDWSISVDGKFVFGSTESTGTIAANAIETVETSFIFGIGNVDIIVTANYVTATHSAFMIGPFVLSLE